MEYLSLAAAEKTAPSGILEERNTQNPGRVATRRFLLYRARTIPNNRGQTRPSSIQDDRCTELIGNVHADSDKHWFPHGVGGSPIHATRRSEYGNAPRSVRTVTRSVLPLFPLTMSAMPCGSLYSCIVLLLHLSVRTVSSLLEDMLRTSQHLLVLAKQSTYVE